MTNKMNEREKFEKGCYHKEKYYERMPMYDPKTADETSSRGMVKEYIVGWCVNCGKIVHKIESEEDTKYPKYNFYLYKNERERISKAL